MTRPFKIQIHTGGSGRGISHWMSWLDCARKTHLKGKYRGDLGTVATNTGTAYHGYQQCYHEQQIRGLDTNLVRFRQSNSRPWDPGETALAAGERLFRGYRVKYPPDMFGKVLYTEKFLEAKEAPWLPEKMRITARLDMVVEATTKSVAKMFELTGLLLKPGVYVVDFKTLGSARWINQYALEPQLGFYQLIWNLDKRRKSAKNGLIVAVAIKDKAESNPYRFIIIPPTTKDTERMIYNALRQARDASHALVPETNVRHCFAYGEECFFHATGRCKRY